MAGGLRNSQPGMGQLSPGHQSAVTGLVRGRDSVLPSLRESSSPSPLYKAQSQLRLTISSEMVSDLVATDHV